MATGMVSRGSRRAFLRTVGLGSAAGVAGVAAAQASPRGESERYRRGLDVLQAVGGAGYDRPLEALAKVSPDFARFVVEYPYGDVLARPNLDLITREALTVAALIAHANSPFPLRFHLNGFLNVGGRPEALVELCFLAIGVCGFPAAIDTTAAIREVLQERGQEMTPLPVGERDGSERHLRGLRNLAVHGENGPQRLRDLADSSPAFARLLVEFVHGELLTRDGLDAKTKYLSVISMLATAGNSGQWLRDTTLTALRHGVSRDEIIEAMIQLSVYAGFPAALVGCFTMSELFGEIDAKRVSLSTPDQTIVGEPSETHAARFARGADTLSVTSSDAGQRVLERFGEIAPEIGRMIVAHAYGDLFSRPGLGRRERGLTAIASMVSLGATTSETPVKVHVNAALNAGATKEEVIETLLNLVPFVGYPKVERGLALASDVFRERGVP